MITRYACALDGVQLHDLDPAIHITDITELAPQQRLVTAAAPGHGSHVLHHTREHLTVRVHFLVRDYQVAPRRAVIQQISAWASKGTVLTTNDRPGQRLCVRCTSLPWGGALSWLDEMTIDLTAFAIPFWEAEEEAAVTITDAGELTIPGTADECLAACEVVNTGDAPLTTLTVAIGDTSMTFEGLSLPVDGVFSLTAPEGVLRATADGASVLMHRTAESADLLLARSGATEPVSVTADQPVSATFSARGRYL